MLGRISNSSTQKTQLSKTLLRNKNYAKKKSMGYPNIQHSRIFYLKNTLSTSLLYTQWSSKIRDLGLNFRSVTS